MKRNYPPQKEIGLAKEISRPVLKNLNSKPLTLNK